MSASNWRKCPKCDEISYQLYTKERKILGKKYGKISESEYNKKLQEIVKKREEFINSSDVSLREDYEIGTESNRFYYSYSASCVKCDFRFDKKDEEEFYVLENSSIP